MKLLMLAVLCAAGCYPYDERMRSLRANMDGSLLYFLTDMRLAGSDQAFHGKAFVTSGKKTELLVYLPKPAAGSLNPDPYIVDMIDVSSDGEVIAYGTFGACDVASCSARRRSTVQTREGKILWQGEGSVRISPNGRYALAVQPSGVFRVDLSTGQRQLVISGTPSFYRAANDGTAFLQFAAPRFHRLGGGVWQIYEGRFEGLLSGDGSTMVLSPGGGQGYVVRRIDEERTLIVPGTPLAISHDGSRILTRLFAPGSMASEIYLFDTVQRQLSLLLEGAVPLGYDAAISGDGRVAFLSTPAGILRVDTDTRAVTPHVLSALEVRNQGSLAVAGSLSTVVVNGVFQPQLAKAESPLPLELGGFRVTVNGTRAPVRQVSAGPALNSVAIQFQVPWETAQTTQSGEYVSVLVERGQETPFESFHLDGVAPNTEYLLARSRSVKFLRTDGTTAEAIHQELDRPVTAADPARPGEVVHVYLTGLGAVNKEVTTGKPAPSEPPARPLDPLVCQPPALDTILAPGKEGIFRASFAIPSGLVGPFEYRLACDGDNASIPAGGRP